MLSLSIFVLSFPDFLLIPPFINQGVNLFKGLVDPSHFVDDPLPDRIPLKASLHL